MDNFERFEVEAPDPNTQTLYVQMTPHDAYMVPSVAPAEKPPLYMALSQTIETHGTGVRLKATENKIIASDDFETPPGKVTVPNTRAEIIDLGAGLHSLTIGLPSTIDKKTRDCLLVCAGRHKYTGSLLDEILLNIEQMDLEVTTNNEPPAWATHYNILYKIFVSFDPIPGGVSCELNGVRFDFPLSDTRQRMPTGLPVEFQPETINGIHQRIIARNAKVGAGAVTLPATQQLTTRNKMRSAPYHTFAEARETGTAICDGRTLRNWSPAAGGSIAMLHASTDRRGRPAKLQTRFEPSDHLLNWWGRDISDTSCTHLEDELKTMGFDALMEFFTVLGTVLESPTLRITVTIDDLIDAIGRGSDARRSKEARDEWRGKVWRWLLHFDSLMVIGTRAGTWREPRNGDSKRNKIVPEQLYSQDALLKILGTRNIADEQGRLDNSAVPKEVTLTAGAWLEQWQGNAEMLSYYGQIHTIAAIPRGQPSGAWAACAGLMLQQRWRELAHKTPVIKKPSQSEQEPISIQKFKPFARRDLLINTWRSDYDVRQVLDSSNPVRAKKYWADAVVTLKACGIIGYCKETKKLTAGRKDWQDEWLDQPLDIRPAGENQESALRINQLAKAARKRRV